VGAKFVTGNLSPHAWAVIPNLPLSDALTEPAPGQRVDLPLYWQQWKLDVPAFVLRWWRQPPRSRVPAHSGLTPQSAAHTRTPNWGRTQPLTARSSPAARSACLRHLEQCDRAAGLNDVRPLAALAMVAYNISP
jgi:hypothetical protein